MDQEQFDREVLPHIYGVVTAHAEANDSVFNRARVHFNAMVWLLVTGSEDSNTKMPDNYPSAATCIEIYKDWIDLIKFRETLQQRVCEVIEVGMTKQDVQILEWHHMD